VWTFRKSNFSTQTETAKMINWQDIKVSADSSHFTFNGKLIFDKKFIEVLKYHSPGLAAVQDESGSYHIDIFGNALYVERYKRTFGFYCNRATVVQNERSFHITEKGIRAYSTSFLWCGNFQENLCSVRDSKNNYFHIDLNGEKIYSQIFLYVGDFKDGIACVKIANGFYKHIDVYGNFINDKEFYDLGIFHKNFATAKDKKGWHHIDKYGNELYPQRFQMIEPFYNGFAVVDTFDNNKLIIDENGKIILEF